MNIKPDENIIKEIEIISTHYPNKIAIYMDEITITYSELNKIILNTIKYLKSKTIARGDIVALLCNNELHLLILFLSLSKLDVTSLIIQNYLNEKQRKDLLNQSSIKKIITNDKNKFNYTKNLLLIDIEKDIFLNYNDIEEIALEDSSKYPICITIGSGSSGKQKLMALTHKNIYYRISIIHEFEKINDDDIITSFATMDFPSTIMRSLATLCAGAAVVISTNKDFSYINKYKITNLGAAVFHIEQLILFIEKNNYKPSKSLKTLVLGFSVISNELREKIKRLICKNLLVGYGTNETGAISISKPPYVYNTIETIGFISKEIEIEIVDKKDNILKNNSVGFIRVKSPASIEAYLNDNISTSKNFKDGWFYPNDLVKISEDNQLIYKGRADEMMLVNGINIYPYEIEQTLLNHEEVSDVYVTSLKSKKNQNILICIIRTKDKSHIKEKELHVYSRNMLGLKSPSLFIISNIPRTEQGKVLKKDIESIVHSKLVKNNT